MKIEKYIKGNHIELLNYLLEVNKTYHKELNIDDIETYAKKLDTYAEVYFVIYNNVNIAMCAFYINKTCETVYISSFSVKEKYIKKSIGKLLLQFIRGCASMLTCKIIELEVNRDNLKALKFYQQNKFYIHQENFKTYIMRDNI